MGEPEFPVGRGANSRGGYVSNNLYVKMKESGPLGGIIISCDPTSLFLDLHIRTM